MLKKLKNNKDEKAAKMRKNLLHTDILSSLKNILTKVRIAGTGHKTHLNLILGNTACLSFSNFLTSITQVLHRPTHTHMHEHSHTHIWT